MFNFVVQCFIIFFQKTNRNKPDLWKQLLPVRVEQKDRLGLLTEPEKNNKDQKYFFFINNLR